MGPATTNRKKVMSEKTTEPVTIESIQARIASIESVVFSGRLTVVVLTMQNGFLVTGESCCAPETEFSEEVGREAAYTAALEKAWQLENYLLRERNHAAEASKQTSLALEPANG